MTELPSKRIALEQAEQAHQTLERQHLQDMQQRAAAEAARMKEEHEQEVTALLAANQQRLQAAQQQQENERLHLQSQMQAQLRAQVRLSSSVSAAANLAVSQVRAHMPMKKLGASTKSAKLLVRQLVRG